MTTLRRMPTLRTFPAQSPDHSWKPNTPYKAGQLVELNGVIYKVPAPFTSGSSFDPDTVASISTRTAQQLLDQNAALLQAAHDDAADIAGDLLAGVTIEALAIEARSAAPYTIAADDLGKLIKLTAAGTTGDIQVGIPVDTALPEAQVGMQVDLLGYSARPFEIVTQNAGGGQVTFPLTNTAAPSGLSLSHSIAKPDGLLPGDTIIVAVATTASKFYSTLPTGFVSIENPTQDPTILGTGPAGASKAYLFKKENITSDDCNTGLLTFTTTGATCRAALLLVVIRGGAAAPIHAAQPAGGTLTNTQATPALTPTVANTIPLWYIQRSYSGAQTALVDPPAGTARIVGQYTAYADSNQQHQFFTLDPMTPQDANVPYPIKSEPAGGNGTTRTLAILPGPQSASTIRSRDGALRSAGRYATCTLTKIGANEWLAVGDLYNPSLP